MKKDNLQTLLEKKETPPPLLKNKCSSGKFKSIVPSELLSSSSAAASAAAAPPLSKSIANIILHLKCSLRDLNEYNNTSNNNKIVKDPLEYDPSIPSNIFTYECENKNVQYSLYSEKENPTGAGNIAYESNPATTYKNISKEQDDENISIKDINQKLKSLKINFYKNNVQDKKSACFWCTCDYDNASCYVLKCEIDGTLYGYGSFCCPECAVAFLMKENIDDSVKFERFQLMNQYYGKIYNYKKSIKPAPNPYYLLDKYYGNLTIPEYRKLLKNENSLLFIEKPMTRILPELHEDNDNMLYNNSCHSSELRNNTGIYKVKKQSDKKQEPTKSSIIKSNFNIV